MSFPYTFAEEAFLGRRMKDDGHGFNSFEEKQVISLQVVRKPLVPYFPGEQQSTVGGEKGWSGAEGHSRPRLLVLRQLLLSYQVSLGEALKGKSLLLRTIQSPGDAAGDLWDVLAQKLEQEEKGLLIFPQELPLEETLTQGPYSFSSMSIAVPTSRFSLLDELLGEGAVLISLQAPELESPHRALHQWFLF